ncbi:MAG: DUF2202 domain-containing protein [Flavobacteriales bacterium]
MKKITLLIVGLSVLNLTNCKSEDPDDSIPDTTTPSLTQEQEANLQFMQEEEKLARDVYTTFYEKWEDHPFSNISGSEQDHMNRIQAHMDEYGVESLVKDEAGVFTNSALQSLYDSLTTVGLANQVDALMIGAEIEELDILDLMDAMETHFPEGDINTTYQNLMDASKKHLYAYTKYMSMQFDTTYVPRHMSQSLYEQMRAEGKH